jgi:hypothetical protein
MSKLYESHPDDYQICGSCTGSGSKIQLQRIPCPECQGTGSIKKRQKIKLDPAFPRTPQSPNPKSKQELQTQFEQELAKAEQLKASLLVAVRSSVLLSAETIEFSRKRIGSIDPLSKHTEDRLEELQRDWAKELSITDPLLVQLREFKVSCFAAETYYSLVR